LLINLSAPEKEKKKKNPVVKIDLLCREMFQSVVKTVDASDFWFWSDNARGELVE